MSGSHLKRLAFITAIALVALGASFYLIARPLPERPVPAAPPVGVAVPSPVATMQASSTQPKITWSQNQIEMILSPGESTSRAVTFASNLDLQNIVVEAVPEIAGFLSVEPNSF